MASIFIKFVTIEIKILLFTRMQHFIVYKDFVMCLFGSVNLRKFLNKHYSINTK